jgi:FAD/FMN-containing dehydrogenase
MNVEMMSEMADASNSTFWDTVQRLKNALDPGGILSPGRYSPSPLVGAPRASR